MTPDVLTPTSIAAPEPRGTKLKRAIVLFGPPGSGKGTQSQFLIKRLGIPQISTGDMLREHIRCGDDIGQAIEQRMRAGSLVSDELVNTLVAERLKEPDTERGFILDGYPRTSAQGRVLIDLLEKNNSEAVVIHLLVDYNIIIARITGRRQCPQCGTLYNLHSRPPKIAGICDIDGASLIVREDDREDVIRERLDSYGEQTSPLIAFFRESGRKMFEVDASYLAPVALSERICDLLDCAAWLEKRS